MHETQAPATDKTISPARELARQKHLEGMAERIRLEVEKVEAYLRHTVKHALLAGKLLCEVKRMVGHGNWLTWFHAQQFSFGEVTAQRYMRLSRSWPEIKIRLGESGNPSSLTDLTFNDALEMLSKAESGEVPIGTQPALPAKKPNGKAKSSQDKTPLQAEPQSHQLMVQETKAVAMDDLGLRVNDWLTPIPLIEAVVRVLGAIDLDPAADSQRSVPASQHFTAVENGLEAQHVWLGKVFLNPPGEQGLLEDFTIRLATEFSTGNVQEAILLVRSETNADWYRRFRNFGRVLIASLDSTSGMYYQHGLTAIYLGHRQAEFFEVFQELGDGYVPYRLCLDAGE